MHALSYRATSHSLSLPLPTFLFLIFSSCASLLMQRTRIPKFTMLCMIYACAGIFQGVGNILALIIVTIPFLMPPDWVPAWISGPYFIILVSLVGSLDCILLLFVVIYLVWNPRSHHKVLTLNSTDIGQHGLRCSYSSPRAYRKFFFRVSVLRARTKCVSMHLMFLPHIPKTREFVLRGCRYR